MNSRSKLLFGLSAIAALGAAAGVSTHGFSVAAFATAGPNAKKALSEAAAATKAIAKRNGAKAVAHAEAAVMNDPDNAEYRALLGQSYLLAGRFASAAQALSDALTLNPEDGRAALNLALAKVAAGDWAGARSTLEVHADHIPASDRGLAFALSGDPVSAINILMPAAREASSTTKTRQNLALSLALAGRWQEARALAAVDVAPDQLDARMMEWAAFARPTNAYDQVASLLGVRAVEDQGQPVRLALSQQPGVMVAAVAPQPVADPVDAYMPGSPVAVTASVEPVAQPRETAPAQPEVYQVAGTEAQVVFGPRAEIVQAIPAVRVAARPAASRLSSAPDRAVQKAARGNYYVQLGAYANAGVARDAWARQSRRLAVLADATPQGANISTRAGNFYRLSVGGFARSDATALCGKIRSAGGSCFVRAQAGDAVAHWARPGRNSQLASR